MSETSAAFFVADGPALIPQKWAKSHWSESMLSGPPVCGSLARALEREYGDPDLHPARLTVDMFRPVRNQPLHITTTLVRDGNRIRVGDATITQEDAPVCRATAVFLRRSGAPPGEFWTRDTDPDLPEHVRAETFDPPAMPFFGSDAGWSRSRAEHQGDTQKRLWLRHRPLVDGEEDTPFVAATTAGELTSLLTNWGSAGVGYINADLTLAFARMPEGHAIGLEADNHVAADGLSVGVSRLFDRRGVFGTGVVTALANADRLIDYTSR